MVGIAVGPFSPGARVGGLGGGGAAPVYTALAGTTVIAGTGTISSPGSTDVVWTSQQDNYGSTIWTSGTDLLVPTGADMMTMHAWARSSNSRGSNTCRLYLKADGVIIDPLDSEVTNFITGGPMLSGLAPCDGVTDFILNISLNGSSFTPNSGAPGLAMRVDFWSL